MLAYHPAKDIYHCCFRLLKIMFSLSENSVEIDRLILMDYYSIFPYELQKITLPAGSTSHRKIFKKVKRPYESIANPKRLIFELRGIQTNAIKYLVAIGILVPTEDYSIVSLNYKSLDNLPSSIDLQGREPWFISMLELFQSVELLGEKGIKARTGLMEYRYDVF